MITLQDQLLIALAKGFPEHPHPESWTIAYIVVEEETRWQWVNEAGEEDVSWPGFWLPMPSAAAMFKELRKDTTP